MNSQIPNTPSAFRQQGFTLVELMVASVLSLIIIAAVGGAYVKTSQLNNVATTRLKVQQDLRSATGTMVRDIRQAGTFGCFVMGTGSTINGVARAFNPATAPYNYSASSPGVVWNSTAPNFGTNFVSQSGALILQTGATTVKPPVSVTPASGGGAMSALTVSNDIFDNVTGTNIPVMVSSCLRADIVTANYAASGTATINIPTAPTIPVNQASEVHLGNTVQISDEMQTLLFKEVAYVVGRIGTDNSACSQANPCQLYRFEHLPNGWSTPQLMAQNVSAMSIQAGYPSCPAGATTYSVVDIANIGTGANAGLLPGILNINLTVIYPKSTAGAASEEVSSVDASGVPSANYPITATIRGGNTCANRNL